MLQPDLAGHRIEKMTESYIHSLQIVDHCFHKL